MKVAVIGAGAMGHGIAQLAATAGHETALVDVSDEILNKALEKIKFSLGKFVEKRRISEQESQAILSRIKPTTKLEDAVRDADFVIEAIPEDLDLKKQLFSKINDIAPKNAILASNTSTLSITQMAEVVENPGRFVGMHFFNPPQLMPLVEIIKGDKTTDQTIHATVNLARQMGKDIVICRKDLRGFIVNRVLGGVFNEGFWAVYRGEATMEQVDAAAKYRAGFPMGIFELADYVGLDVVHAVSKVLYQAYGERAKPCPILEQQVIQGRYGMKTNKGFYESWPTRPRIPMMLADEFDIKRIYAVAANEAAWLIYDGVADPADIDKACKLGLGWPYGPCEIADREGLDNLLGKLRELYTKHGEECYKPCPLLEEYVAEGRTGKKAGRGFYQY